MAMKNYRYIIGRETIIISHDEHESVLAARRQREDKMILRGGTLIFDWKSIRSVVPTSEPTEAQQVLWAKTAKLEAPRLTIDPGANERLAKMHCEFRTKMGWSHHESCQCKKQTLKS